MQLQEDTLFDDRYLLKSLLGRGGFSEVWLAEDIEVNHKKRALKIYTPEKGLDEKGVQIFRNEFEIVCDLNHTHLLRPAHYEVCNGSPYLVMPYCERGSAEKLIGEISEEEAWRFLHDVASGLAYLHEQEPPIIHQDIKPNNVLINRDGKFLITDFGISAKARNTLHRTIGEAKASMTVAYTPPERFGQDHAPIKASDIWSLGATLFELLEGDVPFFDTLGGLAQQNGAEIPKLTGKWSLELKTIIIRCLQKDAWDRPTAVQLIRLAEEHFQQNNSFIKGGQKEKKISKSIKVVTGAIVITLISCTIYIFTSDPRIPLRYLFYFAPPIPFDTTIVFTKKIVDSTSMDVKQVAWDSLQIPQTISDTTSKFSISQKPEDIDKQTPQQDTIPPPEPPAPTPSTNPILKILEDNMVYVQGGTFTMGSNDNPDESPPHRVSVRGFYIGKYEVTQEEWQEVMGDNPSHFKGDKMPVESVSWNDVREFIRQLNDKTVRRYQYQYRLPTEAEWEYVARGGNQSRGYTYSGSNVAGDVAWNKVNSEESTHDVGMKSPNELGIYDMSGNVREWCSDWYRAYSDTSGVKRVVRGGCWCYGDTDSRISVRSGSEPDRPLFWIGFRLARSL